MTTIEILKKARELLSDPRRWAKGEYARTNLGFPTFPDWSNRFGSFCLMGACMFSVETLDDKSWGIKRGPRNSYKEQLELVWQALAPDNTPLHKWNDAPERTHAEVLQRFDEAIARLEATG